MSKFKLLKLNINLANEKLIDNVYTNETIRDYIEDKFDNATFKRLFMERYKRYTEMIEDNENTSKDAYRILLKYDLIKYSSHKTFNSDEILTFYKNDQIVIKPLHYVIYVALNATNRGHDNLIKIIAFPEKSFYDLYSDYMIMKEIVLQDYADQLHKQCNFTVPKIKQVYRFKTNKDEFSADSHGLNETLGKAFLNFFGDATRDHYFCFWVIEMEKIEGNDLRESIHTDNYIMDECETVSNNLNRLDVCLKENNFYHNDYYPRNIFYDHTKNPPISLIDYGEAYLSKTVQTKQEGPYSCKRLKSIKENRTKGGKTRGVTKKRKCRSKKTIKRNATKCKFQRKK